MTLDTEALRRLHGAATLTGKVEYTRALHNAARALLDAADELARVKAVLGSADLETIALVILNSDRAMAGLPPTDSRANCSDSEGYVTNATAALAALRELIARDE